MVRRIFLIGPFLAWFAFFILGPLVVMIMMSFSHRTELGETQLAFEWTAYKTLMDPLYAKVLMTTMLFAAGNTLLTILAAYPLSFFIYRSKSSLRIWLVT